VPELPEVEVVRRGVVDHVVGRTIAEVRVHHPRPVRRQFGGAGEFSDRVRSRTVLDAVRRGKYLWLHLDDDQAVLVHLGMSGQLLVAGRGSPSQRHLRVEFEFADEGPDLRFVDQRMFGGVTAVDLVATADGLPGGCGLRSAPTLPSQVAHIARDPLDPHFDDTGFSRRLRSRHTGLKRALLDQTTISGIGNIYADEALWRAKLHFARPTQTLTRARVTLVLDAVREVMSDALAEGGTSFDALYVNVNGQSGYFDRSLNAYGQVGRPCGRCGTPIVREHFMNRSSFFCPRCQPKPRRTA
jgi:formamidopyrimidine-DNA glycosylase